MNFGFLRKLGFYKLTKRQQDEVLAQVNAELDKELAEVNQRLAKQDAQIASIHRAEAQFEANGDIDALMTFWEHLWASGGLIFNGSKWTFRLPDLYIKQKRYDDALMILKKIKKPEYAAKVVLYREKIAKKRQP